MKNYLNNLIDEIIKIPGNKIVTLTGDNDVFKIDISETKKLDMSLSKRKPLKI